MTGEPEIITKELWYCVYTTSTRSPAVDYPTVEEAAKAAVDLIRSGSLDVTIYRQERLPGSATPETLSRFPAFLT